ncbi:hypothetical protein ACFQ8C_10840 [Streptomyces sp. NPDC056503]|uniref:hypothetical protein n=1 Tax=Streptomyces sp. NPDC056503 TaxID=3345842 RepID=UPI00367B7F52
MANSYTTLWTNDLCRELERSGEEGLRPTILFGGPFGSQPSFLRAGVRPGDTVYPVRAHRTRLHVLGSMEVSRVLTHEEAGAELHDDDYAKLLYWRRLKTGFVSEVLLGPPGSPLSFDTVVPGDLLERLTFTSRRGERTLKHVEDGRLLRSAGVQGVYRLAPASAAELRRLVADRFSGPAGPAAPAASGGRW